MESQCDCSLEDARRSLLLLADTALRGNSAEHQGDFTIHQESSPRKKSRRVTSARAAWRGQYCSVPSCRNSSGQQKDRILRGRPKLSSHSFPDKRKNRRLWKRWISAIRRDPGRKFTINQYSKICSEHFASCDFHFQTEQSQRRRLKSDAVPSIFSWSKGKCSGRRRRVIQRKQQASLWEKTSTQ